MNYKATKSFAMNKNDYEKVTIKLGEILPNDFASEAIINDLLEAGYIVEYDGSLEITENGTYDVTDYETIVVNVGESTPSHTHDYNYREETVGTEEVCWKEWDECSICGDKINEVTHGHNYVEIDDGWGNIETRCERCNRLL